MAKLFLALVTLLSIAGAVLGTRVFSLSPSHVVSPVPPYTPSPTYESLPKTPSSPRPGLEEILEPVLAGAKGRYGIVVKHLRTSEMYTLNEKELFEPASLYKAWLAVTAFDQVAQGKLKETETLSQDIKILNETFAIASESAELTEGRVTLRVKDALEQMITISHNYAALLLAERIGFSKVQTFLRNHGLSESTLGNAKPQTTARDLARFFEALYRGELGTAEHTKRILDTLKRQTINHKLPKYLPKGTIIAHKTGEIGTFTHDVGIVFSDRGDYVIVVLSENKFPKEGEEMIARISKTVYEYFTSR